MDESFLTFYRSLDKNSFKYFVKDGSYFVYEDDLRFLGSSKGSCKVDPHVLDNTIRDVLSVHRLKVQEYENYKLVKEGYPGNWKDFTDIMLDKFMPPSICSVKQTSPNFLQVAFLNTLDNSVYECSFEDDDVFSNFCGLLSEINAFELIYSDPSLDPLVSSLGLLSHKLKGLSALSALLDFLKIEDPVVKEYKRPNICRVDKSALESINMYNPGEKSVADTFECVTNQGHRLLLQFIKHPLRSKEEIEYRLGIVDSLRDVDLSVLKQFPDLLRLTKRIQNSKVTIQELLRLCQVITKIPLLLGKVNTDRLRQDFYTPLLNLNGSLQEIRKKIEGAVDLELASRNIYKLKSGNSELKTCLRGVQEKIKEEFLRVLGIYEKIKYDEGSNSFKITRSEYRLVEDKFKASNFLVTAFLKTGVTFTTKTLSELNTEREEILERMRQEEKVLLEDLKETVRGACPEIEVLNYVIALLDVFNSFSLKSVSPGYCKPEFTTEKIILRDLFHPLLENNQYIPNDLELLSKRMVIITGPNMGGKSTYLKSIAIVSILAQMGCYVPCSYASLPIYDGLFVRMGASDCTYTGDSTFMLEMKDISQIIRNSSPSSLVLIDELGRGTSEIDGLSIALAVRNHLLNLNCVTLFATHFPELTKGDVINKRADSEGVLLLYKIVDGVCEKSFGINVAKKVGFPEDVIEEASNLIEHE